MITKRYEIKFGEYGAYLYDNELGLAFPLEQVKNLLNDNEPTLDNNFFIRYGKTTKPIGRLVLSENLQYFMNQIIQAIRKLNFTGHNIYKAEWKLEITKI